MSSELDELSALKARVEVLEENNLKVAKAIASLSNALASVSCDLKRVCACVNDIADEVYGPVSEEEEEEEAQNVN